MVRVFSFLFTNIGKAVKLQPRSLGSNMMIINAKKGFSVRCNKNIFSIGNGLHFVHNRISPRLFSSLHQAHERYDMFCRQCEQAKDGIGCTSVGICGKTAETSAAQDALVHIIKRISSICVAAREAGASAEELNDANIWTLHASFSTLTNVNFSESRIVEYVHEGTRLEKNLMDLISSKGANTNFVDKLDSEIHPQTPLHKIEEFGKRVGVLERQEIMGNIDASSLNEIAMAGVKGLCAYAAHCHNLGFMDDENIMKPVHEILCKLNSNEPDVEGLLATVLKVGEINMRTLLLLDRAHVSNFGEPSPTQVLTTAVKGKCILVSGHDLKDLHSLLEQTEGKGVNVYTHGEMLPAHSYPELKKFKHLVGNYGTAWQNQKIEFSMFPGPIIMTTNCIVEPRKTYKDRIYTLNEVGADGVKHIDQERDFSDVIKQALHMKGFTRTIQPERHHIVGFNHRAVLPLANEIIKAVRDGELSRIFLIGGCDGTEWDRNYFTDLASSTPDDSIILTMGCAKNRIIQSEKLMKATICDGQLPRVLDMGQCNDSLSAIVVATELAKALECDVNDLPLSLALSHLEQKAAAVLLTLLHLGVKNIRLGPRLPAYVSPNVLQVLSDKFNLMPTGDASKDLKQMMVGK